MNENELLFPVPSSPGGNGEGNLPAKGEPRREVPASSSGDDRGPGILSPAPGSGPEFAKAGKSGGEDPMPEEEAERLAALLRAAYPSPPAGLAASVMERIRAEAAPREGAKILPAADSRGRTTGSRKRGLSSAASKAVRWGATAACVVLVGALALRVLPAFTRNLADTAPQDASSDSAAFDVRDAYEDADEAEGAVGEFGAAAGGAFPASGAVGDAKFSGRNDSGTDSPAEAEVFEEALTEAADEAPAASEWMTAPASAPTVEEPAPAAEEMSGFADFAGADGAAVIAEADDAADGSARIVAEAEDTEEACPEYAADAEEACPEYAENAAEEPSPEPESAAEEMLASSLMAADAAGSVAADGESPAGFAEDAELEGLSLKLFTLNRFEGTDAAVGEAKRMTSFARNAGSSLDPEGERRASLRYYYVRTACGHASAFLNSYHDIPNVLIARVGPELYGAWATKVQREDLCGVNILSFAVRFGLSAEDILSTGDVWYYLDLPDGIPLTEENAEAVEAYYGEGGDPGKMAPRYLVYSWKTAVIREIGLDAYLAWRGEDLRLRGWTLEEAADRFGLTRERMEELYGSAEESLRELLPDAEVPGIDELLKW